MSESEQRKMEDTSTTVSVSIDIALAPTAAFDILIEELATALWWAVSFPGGPAS